MNIIAPDLPSPGVAVLHVLAENVRRERKARKWSQRQLAEMADISLRYLAQLEAGQGNVSIAILVRIALALDKDMTSLLVPKQEQSSTVSGAITLLRRANPADQAYVHEYLSRRAQNGAAVKSGRMALIGMRGAGKSTLGQMAADALGIRFVNLTAVIEERSGLSTQELFNFYGNDGYRRYEEEALRGLADADDKLIIEVGGGIVENAPLFDFLLQNLTTIWLIARPEEMMDRVRTQGDMRPAAGSSAPMDDLRAILKSRETDYRRADHHFNTSDVDVDTAAQLLTKLIQPMV